MLSNYPSAVLTEQPWKASLRLFRSFSSFQWRRFKLSERVACSSKARDLARQLRKTGFLKIEDFYSRDDCRQIIENIEALFQQHPEALRKDEAGSDHRLNVAGGVSAIIDRFHSDPFLAEVGAAYFGCRMTNLFTLTARLDHKAGNEGSGGGWHRDAFFFQFKAMVYLTDVTEENGPFQIFEKSHHIWQVLKDRQTMKVAPFAYRLEPAHIQLLLDQRPQRLKTLVGKAGTLLLFDSSSIHRGMPIKAGRRYALTNYYLPNYMNSPHRLDGFGAILRPKA